MSWTDELLSSLVPEEVPEEYTKLVFTDWKETF